MGESRGCTRRQFGALTGSFVVGTAGCLGDESTSDDTGTEDQSGDTDDDSTDDAGTDDQSDGGGADSREEAARATVEEFYGLAEMVESRDDVDDYIDAIAGVTHSVSPLPGFYRDLVASEDGEITVTVYERVETTVVDEGLGVGGISEAFFLSSEVSDEALEAVAGENLVVEAELSGGTSAFDGSENSGDQEDTVRWLLAPDGGDWLIVF